MEAAEVTMGWTPLPRGGFTGIDWAPAGAADGYDPYLVWAEASAFAGFGGKQPRWLPIAVELTAGTTIAAFVAAGTRDWLRVPPVYTSAAAPAGLRFCTAHVRREFFRKIQPGGSLHGKVQRFELGLPAQSQPEDQGSEHAERRSAGPLLRGKVVGLIDDGLAFANASFLEGRRARTRYFWRQDETTGGPGVPGFDYGQELRGADIEAAIARNTFNGLVDEARLYAEFGLTGLRKRVSHGTHVLDLACGPLALAARTPVAATPPSWEAAGDDAAGADIVAVQLDYDTVQDTSGGSMNIHVLDGLMYILSRCAPSARISVNISFGTVAGPHDGTSLLEAAMDQIAGLCGDRLAISLAAGNSYQSRTHANGEIAPGRPAVLHWRGQPDDQSQNFLEIWLPPGAANVTVQLTPPARPPLPALRMGESRMWTDGGAQPLCAIVYPSRVATGSSGTCILVSIAQSFSFSPGVATAPAGVWTVTLASTGAPVVFDAYIERDDVIAGTRAGARQSHFEDGLYDMDARVDDPSNPTLIRRSGNFNSIATGARTASVGGTRFAGPEWATYSPRKPDPDAGRPSRPGVVKDPDVSAHSDQNPSLQGVGAAATLSGSTVRLRGTSAASPQHAREALNGM